MNWLDYVIIVSIVISAVIGLVRGFVKEVLSLLILALAFWVARNFYVQAAVYLTKVQDEMIRNGIAMAILFIVTLVLGAMVNHLIAQIVSKVGLSGTNGLLGAVFGGLRGVAIVAFLLFFLDAFTPFSDTAEWRSAQLIPYFDGVINWFMMHLEQASSFL